MQAIPFKNRDLQAVSRHCGSTEQRECEDCCTS